MRKRHRVFIKLNLLSLFLLAVSFISITLAWFAYSGLAGVGTEVDVRAWLVEFKKGDNVVTNNIVISLDDIYPGMDTVTETVQINNMGDSDAQISYSIDSARILDEEFIGEDSLMLEDKLSHDYPFHLNINLKKNFVLAKGDTSDVEVSVSWPLDSGNDERDSNWGNAAFNFQENEKNKELQNQDYHANPTLKVIISIKVEQYTGLNDSPDINFLNGNTILYDVVENKKCDKISDTCIKMYVLDVNNKVGDSTVKLLPDLYNNYISGTFDNYQELLNNLVQNWNVNVSPLTIEDVIKVISQDISNSYVVVDGLSNDIIGNVNYQNRLQDEINSVINKNGYYQFLNSRFKFLVTSNCYWIDSQYNGKAFSLMKIDDVNSKVYAEDISATCSIVPVVNVAKSILIDNSN